MWNRVSRLRLATRSRRGPENPPPRGAADASTLARFEQEARALARLQHEAIVPIYEAELTGSTPYIALAYVNGPDLGRWLDGARERGEAVPWKEAVALIAALADAVHHAHRHGIVHRDLKPSNVLLLRRDGSTLADGALSNYQPQLTDFGLAKLAQGKLQDTRTSVIIGTPLYMAPEVLVGRGGATADVYSLGCLLYELLTGQPPVSGDNHVELLDSLRETKPPALKKYRQGLPRGLEAICRKCLEKNPAARYTSAEALARDLHGIIREEHVAPSRASIFTRLRYWIGQPQRAREAGWYAFCINLAAVVWLGIELVAVRFFEVYTSEDYASGLLEGMLAIAAVHVPMAYLGWLTIHKQCWAAWCGVAISLALVGLMTAWQIGWVAPFEPVYRDLPYHAFAFAIQTIVTYLLQAALFACAIVALRRSRIKE
ncbi:MAG: serine/threonine-protein kinase [Pirellulales bacterium]